MTVNESHFLNIKFMSIYNSSQKPNFWLYYSPALVFVLPGLFLLAYFFKDDTVVIEKFQLK